MPVHTCNPWKGTALEEKQLGGWWVGASEPEFEPEPKAIHSFTHQRGGAKYRSELRVSAKGHSTLDTFRSANTSPKGAHRSLSTEACEANHLLVYLLIDLVKDSSKQGLASVPSAVLSEMFVLEGSGSGVGMMCVCCARSTAHSTVPYQRSAEAKTHPPKSLCMVCSSCPTPAT